MSAAMAAGFDYPAATAPFYYGFTPREICGYYRAIAEAAGAPVLIYNFPGNTHREFDLHNPEYISLLRSGAILGVKQTSYNLFQLERILNINPDLVAFDGYDETMVAGLSLGCIGNIGSTFNCMLPHYLEIYNLYRSGKTDEALAMQHTANNCMEALCKHGLIASIKYVLGQQGYDVGDPRAPFLPLDAQQQAELDAALAANLWQP